jgi:transcriptional regulator with XRE-family HTH domain
LTISSHQCRAARALLDWSQSTLARVAGVARATIAEFEAEKRQPIGNNLAAIREAFEAFGVEFIAEPAPGVAVYLDQVEAGIADGQRAVLIRGARETEFVAISVEDAVVEAERAQQEDEINRARAVRRAIGEAKKLKLPTPARARKPRSTR